MKSNPIVLVPLYKNFDTLDETEMASLNRLTQILYRYPIGLFGPATVDWGSYQLFFSRHNINYSIKVFPATYFTGVEGYNRLMLEQSFYEAYQEYSHILIYQPDAYVFKDQLEYWCSSDYDYIGAPWFPDANDLERAGKCIGIGNGGFSLRRTASFIKVLTSNKSFKTYKQIADEYSRYSFFSRLVRTPLFLVRRLMGWRNTGKYYAAKYSKNEDLFWGKIAPESRYNFKIPSYSVALKFSFEEKPAMLYKMNNHELPFGCHAWFKYEENFWRKFISW